MIGTSCILSADFSYMLVINCNVSTLVASKLSIGCSFKNLFRACSSSPYCSSELMSATEFSSGGKAPRSVGPFGGGGGERARLDDPAFAFDGRFV